jgi:hypothetical protein
MPSASAVKRFHQLVPGSFVYPSRPLITGVKSEREGERLRLGDYVTYTPSGAPQT